MRVTIVVLHMMLLAGCMHDQIESTVSIERLRVKAQEHVRLKEYGMAIETYDELGRVTTLTLRDQYDFGRVCYFQEHYLKADSIFAGMQGKDPRSKIALLWRARSNAAIDSAAENGLAVPYFKRLTDPEIKADRNDLREAYHYLGYHYNLKKDYTQMKTCFKKIIELFPEDESQKIFLESIDKMDRGK